MKKYGILACAAFMTLLNGRLDAAVESDIVGYTTITMEAGKWYMVGTPFTDLSDGDIKLNEHYATGFFAEDTLSLYDTVNGYTVYRYKTNLTGEKTEGWCTRFGKTPVDISLEPGVAVFINKNTTGTVTFSGKVPVEEYEFVFGNENGEDWAQITSPGFGDPNGTSPTKLNDLRWTGMEQDDTLSIYDPDTGYTVYRYKKNLTGEKTEGWCTRFGKTPVDVVVTPGQAFFINKISKGQATVKREAL